MLDRIARLDPMLQSYITVTGVRALKMASAAEREIAEGYRRGPLHGLPIALKDLCDTTFAPSTAGMHLHADRIPQTNASFRNDQEIKQMVLNILCANHISMRFVQYRI